MAFDWKRTTTLKFRQLLIITIAWMIFGLLIAVYDHLVLYAHGYIAHLSEYSFFLSAVRNVSAGLIGAAIGGSSLVFFVNVKYQDKPYGYTIVFVMVVFILIVALITLIMGLILVPVRTGRPIFDPVSIRALKTFAFDAYPLKSAMVWSFVVAITQLLLQISGKFGPENFLHIVRGKYNLPKEEDKIFMFIDLNSSTSIAEKLGDQLYHRLLKDFFADLTNPILDSSGAIYQYVGDEVVVSWSYREGKEKGRCLRCFFDMKTAVERNRERYLRRFGLVPQFKAGIHCGKVVAGEVGLVKRDITFSGDVLNTTSRILEKCKEFQAEFISSSLVLEELDATFGFVAKPLGAIRLTGKEKEVSLFSVSM